MAKNGKQLWIAIGLVILIMIAAQGNEKKEVKLGVIEGAVAAIPPMKMGPNEIIKVDKFPKSTLYSVVQPSILQATVADPQGSGDWCFDSSCNCQCSGSFTFCDAWLNKDSPCGSGQEEIISTCPSGTVDAGNNLCCPTSMPNYCSTASLCYQYPNCQLCAPGIEGGNGICCSETHPYFCSKSSSCYDRIDLRDWCESGQTTNLPLIAKAMPDNTIFQDAGYDNGLPEDKIWIAIKAVNLLGIESSSNIRIGGMTEQRKDNLWLFVRPKNSAAHTISIDAGSSYIGNNQCFTRYMSFRVNTRQSSITTITVEPAVENFALPPFWTDKNNGNCGDQGEIVPNLLSECSIGEIKCAGSNTYKSCADIGSNTLRFPNTLQSCPAGNACSNNKCTPDLSLACGDVKQGLLASINAWASNPSSSDKPQILTRIIEWTKLCS